MTKKDLAEYSRVEQESDQKKLDVLKEYYHHSILSESKVMEVFKKEGIEKYYGTSKSKRLAKEICSLSVVDIAQVGEDIICPFCHEDNFDKEGLKHHLFNYCEVHANTENIWKQKN